MIERCLPKATACTNTSLPATARYIREVGYLACCHKARELPCWRVGKSGKIPDVNPIMAATDTCHTCRALLMHVMQLPRRYEPGY